MIAQVPPATMTAATFEFEDLGRSQTLVQQEQFSATVLVGTKWEIEPVKAVVRLERYAPNWDGYGSPPPNLAAANLAIAFLAQIAALGFEDLPRPNVGPIAGGGIALEWGAAGRELNISLFNEGTTGYLQAESGEPFVEGPIAPWMTGHLRSLFSWLLGAEGQGKAR